MDLALDDSQQMLVDTLADMLDRECPTDHVRACESTGFSPELWERYCDLGAHVMGLPLAVGGLGMGLLDLGLIAAGSGRALAPVPFLETSVAGRLLARAVEHGACHAALDAIAEGHPSVSIALPISTGASRRSRSQATRTLVPFGAIAEHVVTMIGDELCVVSDAKNRRGHRVHDLGAGCLARWSLSPGEDVQVLSAGEAAGKGMDRAHAEWKLLAAFWLVGIAQTALEIASRYARERIQFGVPVGSFQSIAHPLAECAIRTDGAELLALEAAWSDEAEPERFAVLSSMAFAWASQTALMTTGVALHTHGGYGVAVEYDIQLFYRRARALASMGGGDGAALSAIADEIDRNPSSLPFEAQRGR